MAFELKMPKLGESVTEGTIGKWLKQPGERVNKYDLLVEVQTDKVNTEIPSPVAGTLKEVKVKEGETVPIGTLLAVFDTADGEAAAQPSAQPVTPAAPSTSAPAQQTTAAPQPPKPAQPGAPQPSAGLGSPAGRGPSAASAPAATPAPQRPSPLPAAPDRAQAEERPDLSDIRATPAVRRLAAEHGIDISHIEGTGLGGRVSRKDVEDFIAQRQSQQQAAARVVPAQQPQAQTVPARPAPATSLAGDELVPLTQMRRAIANNMVQAWSAPHAHAVMEVDMTDLMRYRERVRHEFQEREGFDLSPAAFIAKAVVEALRTVPHVNSSWTDQGLIRHREINLGYAVALGEDGLIVPVIKDADGKSLAGLMRAIRDVVDRAKSRRLTLDDLSGGTFTLNNTGPLGTIVSSPIVPPGQAAILSSESIGKRLAVTDDDSIAIRQMMNIVIGFDHRVVDGSTAARFLSAVRDWLQTTGTSVPVY
ncbi:MAG TPA: dihydrolipoamide acetyltransferase family protein [Candidatus Limnocylindria bacterium]|jgi:2-oxoisovalerate dehydrogenase E2 component (dihydrolipoyl transacylase)|nr:dihydrolipoamide acetyltransferase family protein [Candidatus Limnocylindria bacterium]